MAKCKGCGREIVWAENVATGKPIPLDPSAPVFMTIEIAGKKIASRVKEFFHVSHFCTCPEANKFSGRNKVRPVTDIELQEPFENDPTELSGG